MELVGKERAVDKKGITLWQIYLGLAIAFFWIAWLGIRLAAATGGS
jgi:hypothetical protein